MPVFRAAPFIALASALEDGSAAFYASAFRPGSSSNGSSVMVKLTDAVKLTGARCLDGSPGAYYIRKGTGSGVNKWYIHHQGGGWCESLDDCLGRSKSALGSSTGYTPTAELGGGYFSPLPSDNPMMYNWNSVFLRYCDGGSFSGNNEVPASYKNATLYFRGKRLREAMYTSLLKEHGLGQATDVVVSGCSAGGLATYLHTDQWCDTLAADAPALAKCVGLPDSGFFLDYQSAAVAPQPTPMVEAPVTRARRLSTVPGNYHAGLRWAFETFNASGGVNQDCVAAKETGGFETDQPAYLCMFAEHTSVFTHTPLFALQSEYDSWQTAHVLDLRSGNGYDDVQLLGNNLTKRIGANLFGPHPASGAFLDSCHHHCGAWNQIRIAGQLVSDAFAQWYDKLGEKKAKTVWKQGQKYPCDTCCQPNA